MRNLEFSIGYVKITTLPRFHGLICPWSFFMATILNVCITNPLVRDWLNYKESSEGCSVTTTAKYQGYIQRLADHIGHDQLPSATYEQLLDFTGMHLYKSGLSPSSRKAVIAAVRGYYRWLYKEGHIEVSPADRLVSPKVGRKIPKAIGLKNAEKLLMQPDLETFIGLRDAAIMAMLIGCGMRVSGLIALNEEDLLSFEHEGATRLAVRPTEKGKKERLIPVPNEAMLFLQAYLAHEEMDAIDRLLPDGKRVLFVNTRNRTVPAYEHRGENRRLRKRTVQQMITNYGERAGIPKDQAHPHAMRHLVGAELAEESATGSEMKTLLGHSKVETTDIYVQLALRKLTRVFDTANPLGKMDTTVSPLVKRMKREGLL